MTKRVINAEWFKDSVFSEWVTEVKDDPSRVFCKYCCITLKPRGQSDLRDHASSKRHKLGKQGDKQPSKLSNRVKRLSPSKSRKRPVLNRKPIPHLEAATPYIHIEEYSYQPSGASIFSSDDKPGEFSMASVPDTNNEYSDITCQDEPGIPCDFISSEVIKEPVAVPVSSGSIPFYHYNEVSDDLNYLFGLCVGAGLKKCSEDQASLARLKIQTIIHQATVNELQL